MPADFWQVHPNVQFVADVHSYMMDSAEVIGVLAGRYDKAGKVLYIQVRRCRGGVRQVDGCQVV